MKTLEALYQEILASEELKKSFAEAMEKKQMEEFLKANGCEAGMEEVDAFLKEKQERQGEVADEELDSVAGGGCSSSGPRMGEANESCGRCFPEGTRLY